jgi:hypothetical protein
LGVLLGEVVEFRAMIDIAKAKKQLAAEQKLLEEAEQFLIQGNQVEAEKKLSEYERISVEQPYMK